MPPLLPQQLLPDQAQHQQACPMAPHPAVNGTAAMKKRIAPALVVAVPPAGMADESQQAVGPAQPAVASGAAPVSEAGLVLMEMAETGRPPLAADHLWQQEDGRVHLTGATRLDDAGKEALWAAYIADKELLLELMGVSETAHALTVAARVLSLRLFAGGLWT